MEHAVLQIRPPFNCIKTLLISGAEHTTASSGAIPIWSQAQTTHVAVCCRLPGSTVDFVDENAPGHLAWWLCAQTLQRKTFSRLIAAACTDSDKGCPGWKDSGECSQNQSFMMNRCEGKASRALICPIDQSSNAFDVRPLCQIHSLFNSDNDFGSMYNIVQSVYSCKAQQ